MKKESSAYMRKEMDKKSKPGKKMSKPMMLNAMKKALKK